MDTKAGVWIDHQQAILVLISDGGHDIKKIDSGVEQSDHTPHSVMADNKQERKLVGDRRKFHDEVIAAIGGAKAILVLGPGEAKGEFMKHVESKKLQGVSLEVETTERMTDPQLVAKVVDHFTDDSPNKTVSP